MGFGTVFLAALALGAAGTGLVAVVRRRRRAAFAAALETISGRLGLDYQPAAPGGYPSAGGFFDRAHVLVEARHDRLRAASQVLTCVRVEAPLSSALSVRLRRLGDAFKQALGVSSLRTGDERFDTVVEVEGSELEVLARFDARTRQLVGEALGSGVRFEEGALVWDQTNYVTDPQRLETLVRTCLEIGQRLSARLDLSAALLENAANDPVPAVRDRSLAALLSGRLGDAAAVEAARRVRDDHAPALQIEAATRLGPEGAARLRGLVQVADWPTDRREQALDALVERFGDDEATLGLLRQVLERGDDPLVGACLTALRQAAQPVDFEVIARHVHHRDAATRRVVAQELGKSEDPRASEVLCGMLARTDQPEPVLVAVIRALGRTGDRLAVAPLLPFTTGLWTDGDVKRAGRQAIDAIQARLGETGQDGGRLSLVVDSGGGGLALAGGGGLTVDEGAVGLVDDRLVEDGVVEDGLVEDEPEVSLADASD